MDLLRRAWHIARAESSADFIEDPYQYADFAAGLDSHLTTIRSRLLRSRRWRASPIRRIDVPKSNLAVRPGAQMAMPDRIVLNAILATLSPSLGKQLANGVFSRRPRLRSSNPAASELSKMLQFPFLKGKTVRRYLLDTEPWYVAWPKFVAEARRLATSDYPFMVVTDIAAYFENIDLHLLREILRRKIPRQHRNLLDGLFALLEAWEWPAAYRTLTKRGIPQGDDTCRMLGNAYLSYLDEAFNAHPLVRSGRVRYLRYMDDVKLLARRKIDAIRALQLMNTLLRDLRLNIQGSKTRLLKTRKEILHELTDARLDRVNQLIDELQLLGDQRLSQVRRRRLLHQLNLEARTLKNWHPPKRAAKLTSAAPTIEDSRDMRVYSRILTARILLQDSSETPLLLHQVFHNPDARLLARAIRYFENVPDRGGLVARAVLGWFSNRRAEELLFAFTKGKLLRLLRHMPALDPVAFRIAARILRDPQEHAYVRQQAAQLLTLAPNPPAKRQRWRQLLSTEKDPSVKRVLLGLCLPSKASAMKNSLTRLAKDSDPAVRCTANYFHRLACDKEFANATLSSLARRHSPYAHTDCQIELHVIKAAGHWPAAIVRDPKTGCLRLHPSIPT